MSDLIDRQAVIETIDSRIEQIKKNADAINESYSHLSFAEGVHDGYCRLKCDLRILPSVSVSENPNKWIPVSERLPEEEHEVYCQLSDGSNAVLYVQDNWGQMDWVDGMMGTGTYDVVAWREKPEPYKAESEQQKSEKWVNFADDLIPIIKAESEDKE